MLNDASPPCASSTVTEWLALSTDFTTPSACSVLLPSNGAGRPAADDTSGAAAINAPAMKPRALPFIYSSIRIGGGNNDVVPIAAPSERCESKKRGIERQGRA